MQYTGNHLEQLIEMLPDEKKESYCIRSSTKQIIDDFIRYSTDFICLVDDAGIVKRVNEVWANKLGYEAEKMEGEDIFSFIYSEDAKEMKEDLLKPIPERKEVLQSANRYRIKDGTYRWIDWKRGIVSIGGERLRLGIGRDITTHKENESKRVELQKNLEREKCKNLFFSTVSHEFKTPLNIILSITQLLEQSIEQQALEAGIKEAERYINLISRNAYKTLKVANNLIDLIKLDARLQKINYRYYNIIEVVEEITMAVADYTANKEINILFDTEVEELVVWCDDSAIERIMLNLLSNAIKYSPKGAEISINLKVKKDYIGIAIKDEGPGIVSDLSNGIDMGQIIWGNNQGGLGLKIVDQLVKCHEGNLFVKCEKGTEIIFTLPIEKGREHGEYTHRESSSAIYKEKCNIELCDI
ncbi:MAG: PAS domain-containing sensor histidine kinase [Cellulosilyticaceae bacterium]